jgi:hypothetical protein
MATPKEITVNISKKIGRTGEFGSDMISASITMSIDEGDDLDMVYTGAWLECQKQIDEQSKILEDKKLAEKDEDKVAWIKEESPAMIESKSQEPLPGPSICPVHNIKMEPKEGKYGKFYSHAQKVGDKLQFCSGKGWK